MVKYKSKRLISKATRKKKKNSTERKIEHEIKIVFLLLLFSFFLSFFLLIKMVKVILLFLLYLNTVYCSIYVFVKRPHNPLKIRDRFNPR